MDPDEARALIGRGLLGGQRPDRPVARDEGDDHPRSARKARTAGRDVVVGEGESEIGDDEAGLVAAIVALAVEGEAVEGLAADQRGHAVGELDLAARAFAESAEDRHDLGLEDVAADHAQVGRRVLGRRLLDQALHLGQPAVARAGRDDAVARGRARRGTSCAQTILPPTLS